MYNPTETPKYSLEDRDEILRLFKVGNATKVDMDNIYELLKKYVRPGAAPYQLNCNCILSISAYYQALLEWYSSNADVFNEKLTKKK
jgi:uncharacterized membrane protein YjdF